MKHLAGFLAVLIFTQSIAFAAATPCKPPLLAAPLKVRTQKLEAVLAALGEDSPYYTQDLKSLKKVKVPRGKLTHNKAISILQQLVLLKRKSQEKGLVKGYLQRNELLPDAALKHKVEDDLLKAKTIPDLVANLKNWGLIKDASTYEQVRTALTNVRKWKGRPVAQGVLFNSLLVYLGVSPLYVPDFRLLQFVTMPTEILDVAATDGVEAATVLAKDDYKNYARAHSAIRGARKVWSAAVLTLVVYMAYEIAPMVKALYESSYGDNTESAEDLKQYEDEHYEPSKIVEDELQSWIDAFDQRPSDEAIQKKRIELHRLEKQGKLKVYTEEDWGSE